MASITRLYNAEAVVEDLVGVVPRPNPAVDGLDEEAPSRLLVDPRRLMLNPRDLWPCP